MKLFVCLAAALSIVAITATAQSPPAASFDVASVKRNTSGGGGSQMRNLPGNVSTFNVPARQVILVAYQLQDFQIVGAPDWATSDRFDVEGRFDPAAPLVGFDTPPQRMSAMLKTLLRDRFGMIAHTETREMPVLALTIDRADRRLGPQIKPATVDCAALAAARGRGGPPPDGRSAALHRTGVAVARRRLPERRSRWASGRRAARAAASARCSSAGCRWRSSRRSCRS